MWQTKYASAVPKIWDWDWIFGRAVKAFCYLGVRSPWSLSSNWMTLRIKVLRKYHRVINNSWFAEPSLCCLFFILFSEIQNFLRARPLSPFQRRLWLLINPQVISIFQVSSLLSCHDFTVFLFNYIWTSSIYTILLTIILYLR